MAKRKKNTEPLILAAEPIDVNITHVLESNYMPYAMSVIVSRAIPAIDGFSLPTESFSTPCTVWGF